MSQGPGRHTAAAAARAATSGHSTRRRFRTAARIRTARCAIKLAKIRDATRIGSRIMTLVRESRIKFPQPRKLDGRGRGHAIWAFVMAKADRHSHLRRRASHGGPGLARRLKTNNNMAGGTGRHRPWRAG